MSLAVFPYIQRYFKAQDHFISVQDILHVIKHTYRFRLCQSSVFLYGAKNGDRKCTFSSFITDYLFSKFCSGDFSSGDAPRSS